MYFHSFGDLIKKKVDVYVYQIVWIDLVTLSTGRTFTYTVIAGSLWKWTLNRIQSINPESELTTVTSAKSIS